MTKVNISASLPSSKRITLPILWTLSVADEVFDKMIAKFNPGQSNPSFKAFELCKTPVDNFENSEIVNLFFF